MFATAAVDSRKTRIRKYHFWFAHVNHLYITYYKVRFTFYCHQLDEIAYEQSFSCRYAETS